MAPGQVCKVEIESELPDGTLGNFHFFMRDPDIQIVGTVLDTAKGTDMEAYDETTSALGWVSGGDRLDKEDPYRTYKLFDSARLPVGKGVKVDKETESETNIGFKWYLTLVNTGNDDANLAIIYGSAAQLLSAMLASALLMASCVF